MIVSVTRFVSFLILGKLAQSARPLPPASVNKNLNATTTAKNGTSLINKPIGAIDCPVCPVCYNCLMPDSPCANGGTCNSQTGRCSDCPVGFGGDNCALPMCQSLVNYQRKLIKPEEDSCVCEEGWGGINCNVCQNDQVCQSYRSDPSAQCVKSSFTSVKSFRQCTANLPPNLIPGGKESYITVDCSAPDGFDKTVDCNFQFWAGTREENFYCKLSDCKLTQTSKTDFNYKCGTSTCGCIKGATLCSTSTVDITPFLDKITGPVELECAGESNCVLKEETLNSFFSGGLPLTCFSGECLLPGEIASFKGEPTGAGGIVGIAIGSLFALAMVIYLSGAMVKRQSQKINADVDGSVDDEAEKLQESYIPAVLSFDQLQYNLNGHQILNGISGVVKPGQVMAIIGGSGAGKSTCLDILAGKEKSGIIMGGPKINGVELSPSLYRKMVGFVDQEDTLLGTLTVRETLLYSAMLRLPKSMSMDAKKVRVQQAMKELGIEHIADRQIGMPGKRGISGGEKRRVSIAQELVTSPSILFLDEPTSGLDAYNALLVVETIVKLARDLKRTVVMTIHQPRPMIFSLFDQLLVLATGNMIYSGPVKETNAYFESIGHPIPPQYNTPDYLIDLTLKTSQESRSPSPVNEESDIKPLDTLKIKDGYPFAGIQGKVQEIRRHAFLCSSDVSADDNRVVSIKKSKASERIEGLTSSFTSSPQGTHLKEVIQSVVKDYENAASQIKRMKSYRISFSQQFMVLSNRTMMNLYRNPYLIMSHYGVSIVIAIFTGLIFWNVPNDFAGIQNRFGSLFFSLLFFGFVSMTTLDLFAPERLLFIRERANGFYQPFPYFASKVIFDVIPLRVIPPILYGGICYYMIGLRPGGEAFGTFLFILILFNLAISSMCLIIAISIKQASMGNLVASICMLFCMLFSGFLLNKDNIPTSLGWIIYFSPFYYAFEALAVNEISKVTIVDKKLIEFSIPGGVILEQFGFKQGRFGIDIGLLIAIFTVFMTISFLLLKYRVKEQR